MKKSKLLMPLIGLTSVGMFIVPTVTSCGCSTTIAETFTMTDVTGGGQIMYAVSTHDVKKGSTYRYIGAKYKKQIAGNLWFATAPTTSVMIPLTISKMDVKIGGKAATVEIGDKDYTTITPAQGVADGDDIVIDVVYSEDGKGVKTSLYNK